MPDMSLTAQNIVYSECLYFICNPNILVWFCPGIIENGYPRRPSIMANPMMNTNEKTMKLPMSTYLDQFVLICKVKEKYEIYDFGKTLFILSRPI